MTNEQLLEFSAKQKKLADIISESSNLVRVLDMENCASTLQQISNKMTSDNFKIMVMGNFKNGKSTFINALLGQEVLPAFAVPTTAIINELKYGEAPKAVLHFLNPLPAQMYDGIPEKALEHMQAHNMENIPPIEMPVDEIEDYVVIPMGMDHKAASKQSPFEKVELFWPLELLKNGVEVVDSPGLNENPVRTQVTLEYLNKADAIIFVFSSLAMGSKAEIDYIEDTLHTNGFDNQSIFCVVNRFDQVQENQRQRLVKFTENLLAPYTNHIYYTSSYNALMGKIENNPQLLEESNLLLLESEMIDFLTKERGKIKLTTPARELTRIIKKDVLEVALPQKRSALATDLNVLKKRYDDAKPEIEKIKKQRDLIISRTEASIANIMPDIRRVVTMFFSSFPSLVRAWVDEYTPETTISMFHLKRDAEALTDEIKDYIDKRIDAETREWLNGPFTKLVEDKIEVLKETLEGRLTDFYLFLDDIKFNISGVEKIEQKGAPAWERVLAAGGGYLLGGIGSGIVGGAQGFTAELAKSIAFNLGGCFLLAFVGMLNPVTFIALVVFNVLLSSVTSEEKTVIKVKEQITEKYCEEISNNNLDLVETAVKAANENFNKIHEIISTSLNVEVEEMQNQIEGIIKDLEQGDAVVKSKNKELDECENKLKKAVDDLDSFVFDLLK